MNVMHHVLHGVAIKKHVDSASVSELTAIAPDIVKQQLERAVATGRAVETNGKFMLSPAGRMILEGQYGLVCAEMRADPAFVAAYDRFELINTELKQIVTDWQTVNVGGQQVPNDHSDADYDEKIIDRIGNVHERVQSILAIFHSASSRFGYYTKTLEAALGRAEDGAHEWVSDATIESYHTVWFEMHEDLLRVLERQRDE